MEFKFKISKLANQFFFISNLSEWHFSCRRQYNQIWRGMLPPFTKEQEKSLQRFGKVLEKRGKAKGTIYFPILYKAISGENINAITSKMNNEERNTIIHAFRLFHPAFRQIWKESKPRLQQFIPLIKKARYQNKIKKAFEIIEIYFGKSKCDSITAYLFIAPKNQWGGGGGNIGPGRITMEIGDVSFAGVNWASTVFVHEATHKCCQDDFIKLLKTFTKSLPANSYKNFTMVKFFGDLETVLSELITSSIIGEGLINRLVFKFPSEDQLRRDITKLNWQELSFSALLRKSAALALYSLNSRYLKNKRLIDSDYIKYSFEFLKKFEKKFKKGCIKELAYL